MSGGPVTVTLETDTGVAVLKKILEVPPPKALDAEDEDEKEKLCSGDGVELDGGVSGLGPSAALTPAIWEKTIPYDSETFHLEYMDLEEFLIENGIASVEEASQKASGKEDPQNKVEKPSPESTAPATLLPVLELDQCEEEVVSTSVAGAGRRKAACFTEIHGRPRLVHFNPRLVPSPEATAEKDRATPDPDNVEVEVNFDPDPTDLVLSSVPGGELFDPRKHRFSAEELRPQPMIKKAKKVFVPDEQKNEKYWQRRKKNNIAAKRSRDARRLKENQITVRAAFLERENTALRQEVAELRSDFGRCKKVVERYEAKFGAL
ncbi:TEF transcription factor, PAR bZIP family member a isoform X1 [Denticeps clupeoides]|uniref:TEF transcription factor, PAR bZIP family member a isoform X1 n=1 Tax=Denticeps clupeoides TaxID=299321 RepID=UPI0010A57BC2|nr:thyrotroph embryonic factor-like isoform X1 [Denticeps clupeoides]